MLRWATLLFLLFQGTSAALAAEWRVARTSGPVSLSAAAGRVRVAAGMTIPDGSTLSTGSGGRVRLVRGVESIVVGPNTVVTPKDGWFGTTTIEQPVGRIELEVEKRGFPHLTVETPLLAAVVKGTHFTVTVSRRAASVSVARGVVGVTDLRSGSTADITPGQRAGVSLSGAGLHVSGTGLIPGVRSGLPRSPVVTVVTPQQAAAQAKASKSTDTGTKSGPSAESPGRSRGGAAAGPADHGGRGGPGGRGDAGPGGGRGSDHETAVAAGGGTMAAAAAQTVVVAADPAATMAGVAEENTAAAVAEGADPGSDGEGHGGGHGGGGRW